MKRVFILGAGFSHKLSNNSCPLTRDLGLRIFTPDFLQEHPILLKYYNPERSLQSSNIEHILTHIDLILENKKVDELKEVRNNIQIEVFNILKISNINKDLTSGFDSFEFCKKLFKKNDVIISFNYDCLLEHILWRLEYWHYEGGYGEQMAFNDRRTNETNRFKNIKILKLHGSLNFKFDFLSYCFVHLPSEENFPNCYDHSSYTNNGSDTTPIILPSYIKHFAPTKAFRNIYHEAIRHIREADIISIIGYSLPDADIIASTLLSHIGTNRDSLKPDQRKKKPIYILIINTDETSKRIITNIHNLGHLYDIQENIDKFNKFDIDNNGYNEYLKKLEKIIE